MQYFFYLIDNAIPICRLLLYSLSVLILITMSLPKERPPFKMSQKYIVDIPTNGQMTVLFLFPVVICNLIKEPAKKHSEKPAKTIRVHGTPQTLQPMARRLYHFFSGCNLIKEPAKTIRAHRTPKHSNRRPDNCTSFFGRNLINKPAKTWNPPNIFIPPNLHLLTLITFFQ